jgi:two-component system OmpR family sensor kinase
MRRIHQEACRMARIVDTLLQLNDLDERGLTQRLDVDLVPRLRDIVADMGVIQPEREIHLRVPATLHAHVDPDQIAQAVMVLASNAMRHTPVEASICLRAQETEGRIRVEVSDAGPGIPAEHLPHLFERFYRADRGRERRRGGSGLGLAIMSSIVTAHGGTHGALSSPDQGSTFWFEVPRDAPRTPGPVEVD